MRVGDTQVHIVALFKASGPAITGNINLTQRIDGLGFHHHVLRNRDTRGDGDLAIQTDGIFLDGKGIVLQVLRDALLDDAVLGKLLPGECDRLHRIAGHDRADNLKVGAQCSDLAGQLFCLLVVEIIGDEERGHRT